MLVIQFGIDGAVPEPVTVAPAALIAIISELNAETKSLSSVLRFPMDVSKAASVIILDPPRA